ncbi:hypothetical protein [Inquilinus limosus]|uniref:Uncharacterized protein n=1 Tax=Inquilinus limosus TaxID=171674 RepID=A0A211ZM26_9PROT|nr:hypothetical protein [Inquilinus limosus]OWJ66137.1 hypothetical protein BWR60_16220 [Inquilinus limosus]
MDDKTNNLVLEHLRAIRTDLSEVKTDLREVKTRLGLLEGQVASLFGQYAVLSNRIDRQGDDIEQIRKRLNLVEA